MTTGGAAGLVPVRHVDVDGVAIACREAGEGDPVVLLHGNPTSSYLWRGVQPALAAAGHRTVALDLMGMGASGRPPGAGADAFRFVSHRRYVEGALAALGVDGRVVLVGHDWGGALAFDWAVRHPDAVRGIAYTETIVRPRSLSEESRGGQALFTALRGPEGERMVLDDNMFVEKVLPGGMLTPLAREDHDAYRAPYLEPGASRLPLLQFPREIPFDGVPADVTAIVEAYSEWLLASPVPKLFVRADPGAILTGDAAEFCRRFPAQDEVVVRASHFVPEDAPAELSAALESWLARLP